MLHLLPSLSRATLVSVRQKVPGRMERNLPLRDRKGKGYSDEEITDKNIGHTYGSHGDGDGGRGDCRAERHGQ